MKFEIKPDAAAALFIAQDESDRDRLLRLHIELKPVLPVGKLVYQHERDGQGAQLILRV